MVKLRSSYFFTQDKSFYKELFRLLFVISLQNIVAYSVNMVDNIMLGSYSQTALSAAASVNQVYFMVQQFARSIGSALVAMSAQYWAHNNLKSIRKLTGLSLKLGITVGAALIIICSAFPETILRIFTDSEEIIAEGCAYLKIVIWSFFLYIITQTLMFSLQAVGTVTISFYVSLASLLINSAINYLLIFGKLGFPEMGIRGAAIATVIARFAELLIVLLYLMKKEDKLSLLQKETVQKDICLRNDFFKVYWPIMCSTVLWGISVPMQSAILGHLSADAIAANSVASTFYQYLKVVVMAMSSTSAVLIGHTIGSGNMDRIKSDARTMSVIDVVLGILLGFILFILRKPLLQCYHLNNTATMLAIQLIAVMSIVMVGMSYQMPVSFGIIQGGGDTAFTMKMNMISTWLIVMPFSFAAAFWWKLPVVWVVLIIQSDQLFKGIPTFIHFRKFNWMKKLTRD